MELIAAFDRATSQESAVSTRSGPANILPTAPDAEPFASYLTDESPRDDDASASTEIAHRETNQREKAETQPNEKTTRETGRKPEAEAVKEKENETEPSDETEEPEPTAMVQGSETTSETPKEPVAVGDIAEETDSPETQPSEETTPERDAGGKDVASVKGEAGQVVTDKPAAPTAQAPLPDAAKSAEAANSLQNAKTSAAATPASEMSERIETATSDAAKSDAKLPANPTETLQPGQQAAAGVAPRPDETPDTSGLITKQAEADSAARTAEELPQPEPEPSRPNTTELPRIAPAAERLIQTDQRPIQTTAETTQDSLSVKSTSDGASLLYGRSQPTQETAPTTRTQGTHPSVRLNENELIANIVRQGRLLTRPNGSSEMRISLRPPELGGVLVRLTMENDQLRAELQVETPAVRQAVDSLQQRLRTTLAEEGITLQQFEVDVRQDRPSGGHGGPEDETADGRFVAPTPESIRKASETSATVRSRALSALRDDAGAIDYLA